MTLKTPKSAPQTLDVKWQDPQYKRQMTTRIQKMLDRIEKTSKRRQWLLIIGVVLSLFLMVSALFGSQHQTYQNKQLQLQKTYQQLQREKTEIEASIDTKDQAEIDRWIDQELSKLKEYPDQADLKQVPIQGTSGWITLNQNNLFVSDNAGMLDHQTQREIYEINKRLAASQEGMQLMVVTIDQLPDGLSVEDYAHRIFTQLGIGDQDKNNGILYLISKQDKKFRLEVGYGLEGVIPDAKAISIIQDDDVVEAFQKGDYSEGVFKVVSEIYPLIQSKTAPIDAALKQVKTSEQMNRLGYVSFIIVYLLLLILSIGLFIQQRKVRRQFTLLKTNTPLETLTTGEQLYMSDYYALLLSRTTQFWTPVQWQRALKKGRFLRDYPNAKRVNGNWLVGDTLYSPAGDMLTSAYLGSRYHRLSQSSRNHHSGRGGGGSSGGSSWGSFGGGSSGGGGASGGW